MTNLPTGRRILVTGGAGFVGSSLVELLAAHNTVTVLDDLTTGRRENLPEGVRLIVGDVRSEADVAAACAGAELIFHLAVRCLRFGLSHPEETAAVNGAGSLVVALAAARCGADRLVYVSSSEVYGDMRPGQEPQPTTVYAASKLAGEAYVRGVARTTGLAVTIVRPFNAYGPRCHLSGPSAEVIPRFALRLRAGRPLPVFGDGLQDRAFTWVGDSARGIALAAGANEPLAGPFDISSERRASILEIGSLLGERLGIEPVWSVLPPRPGDVREQHPDPEPARAALGFEARVALSDGLDRFVGWLDSAAPSPASLIDAEQNW